MKLVWENKPGYRSVVIPWRHGNGVTKLELTIEPRPSYCDRGNWIVKAHGPLDHQEGFPRYYFNLDNALEELQLWVNKRQEVV